SSLRDPAAPLGRSREAEVNHVQRSGHTSSALVDGFYINQGKVRAVCMQSARTGMQRQTDGSGFPRSAQRCRDNRMMMRVITNRRKCARLKDNVRKREEKIVSWPNRAERSPVELQLDKCGRRFNVDVALCACYIVPMAVDVNPRVFGINPAVPHHLVSEERVLRYPHRVDLARPAIVVVAAKVRVFVDPADVCSAGGDPPSSARP